jgi:Secretion system C-terminal sorting domain
MLNVTKKAIVWLWFSIILVIASVFTGYYIYRNSNKTPNVILLEKNGENHDADKAATDFAGAAAYEFNMVKNPVTNKIPEGAREMELIQAKEIFRKQQTSRLSKTAANLYSFQGPDNLGGRTRAIAFDVRYNGTSNQTILAGGVSGGVFKSTDNGATWVRKSPIGQHFSATSIAQDPRASGVNRNTWYYATGESLGNSVSNNSAGAFYLGNGLYKSTDNGETWARLVNSNTGFLESFDSRQDLINKVIVNPIDGSVYIACVGAIRKSQDGGNTWTTVLSGAVSSSNQTSDIIVTSTGRLYAAFAGTNAATVDGVWTSLTGNLNDWTWIAGTGAATTPTSWNTQSTYGRVVLAVAPSDEDKVFALYSNSLTSNCTTPVVEAELFRWSLAANAWTDLSANLPDESGCLAGNDPFAVQGGYDLVIAVKPDNSNVVFIGGTSLYRSTDGFATTTNTTRIGGYANTSGYAQYTNSHADIHTVEFQPGSSSIMLCGNDGGIQRTSDNMQATVAWTPINIGYRTYQYYYVALDPRTGNTKVMGGAQDNGTTRNVGGAGVNFENILSGDGVSVGISDVVAGNTVEYAGFQQGGPVYRRTSDLAPGFINANIRPSTATAPGLFVTLFRLDPDNTELIYYASDNRLFRNTSASTATTTNWTEMTGIASAVTAAAQITALANTRGAYNTSTASLFFGTNNGRLFRLDDPANTAAAAAPVNITGASFPASAYVSSIAVNPRNDDTVLVTFSNYGVNSVFWTGNANAATPTWQLVEGNLSLPSYRSSAIAITADGVEYFVGTSVGLYKATIDELSPAATNWVQEGVSEIGNAVVSSLALRPVDNKLLAGTHGYGMWSTTLTLAALPVTLINFSGTPEAKHNSLTWETSNELNNKGFELQRKYPLQQDFTKIAFVNGTNKQGKNNYQANDYAIDLGLQNMEYRLKQIDKDGKFAYSKTITLSRRASVKFIEYIAVQGNNLLIRVNNSDDATLLSVRILDAAGKMIRSFTVANQTQQIDISRLSTAVYNIEIISKNGNRYAGRFVK